MAPSSGRHDADESATDRARIDYLAGEPTAALDPAERAELDSLRALLADTVLWSEPPAELEDSVVALITAEAVAMTETSTVGTDLDGSDATDRIVGDPESSTVRPGNLVADGAAHGR